MRTAIHCRPTGGNRTRDHRRAFTLVELLVSISIFVILSIIALSAFQGSSKDRITAGARQVQAVFNGAKSRAAKAGEPRGVRLLLDPNDRRCVSALQYIGAASYHSGTVRVQVAPSDRTAANAPRPICRVVCEQVGDWQELRDLGLLGSRALIRIPADQTGRWYSLIPPAPSTDIDVANGVGALSQVPVGSEWDANPDSWDNTDPTGTPLPSAPYYTPTFQFKPRGHRLARVGGTISSAIPRLDAPADYSNTHHGSVSYLLRLDPQPLANAAPIQLPPGVVIDLDGSRVPSSWRQKEDADEDGVLDAGEDFDGNGQLDFSANYAPTFPSTYNNGPAPLDIMFGPNGTATGEFAALGAIFLTIAHVSDVELSRPMRVVDATTKNFTAFVPGDYQESYGDVALFPNKERRAVAIYPLTGNVFISQVNGASANSYHLADEPFSYAFAGRDSK